MRTARSSQRFSRQVIVELYASRTGGSSWRLVTGPAPLLPALSPPGSLSCLQRPPRATASGRSAEDIVNDELAARQRAIRLRLVSSEETLGFAIRHKLEKKYFTRGELTSQSLAYLASRPQLSEILDGTRLGLSSYSLTSAQDLVLN